MVFIDPSSRNHFAKQRRNSRICSLPGESNSLYNEWKSRSGACNKFASPLKQPRDFLDIRNFSIVSSALRRFTKRQFRSWLSNSKQFHCTQTVDTVDRSPNRTPAAGVARTSDRNISGTSEQERAAGLSGNIKFTISNVSIS